MKFATFTYKDSTSYGILEGETLFDLPVAAGSLNGKGEQCPYVEGDKFPPDLISLLDLEENFSKTAAWVLGKVKEKGIENADSDQAEKYGVIAVSDVTLKAPIPSPRKVFCVAENYTEHIVESKREDLEHKDSSIPRIFNLNLLHGHTLSTGISNSVIDIFFFFFKPVEYPLGYF